MEPAVMHLVEPPAAYAHTNKQTNKKNKNKKKEQENYQDGTFPPENSEVELKQTTASPLFFFFFLPFSFFFLFFLLFISSTTFGHDEFGASVAAEAKLLAPAAGAVHAAVLRLERLLLERPVALGAAEAVGVVQGVQCGQTVAHDGALALGARGVVDLRVALLVVNVALLVRDGHSHHRLGAVLARRRRAERRGRVLRHARRHALRLL
jgi:hypothetical protein